MHFQKKRCIAMLLAGGQGSRLKVLTEKTAKPAVPFGGKYRIIDFPLSNCVNSGIDTVGILTQYQPLELNEYIGNGQPWGLNKTHSCAQVLPPYERNDKKSGWYKGTANAIYQNIDFIERFQPDYVVILSGDHIYKMDYSAMVEFHEKHDASCTIAVREVPLHEASRFGILNTNPDNSIYEFEEKPAKPKSTKASMGIYVFNWKVLREALLTDEADPNSSNDFGKNIIPAMLNAGEKMYAYPFSGYWKDVGTLKSLWEANMDLIGSEPVFKLNDSKDRIFSRNNAQPPQYIGPDAKVVNAIITEGCEIYGIVENSVLFNSVKIARGAYIKDSVIMNNVEIGEGAQISYSIIDSDTKIGAGATVGGDKATAKDVTVIGSGLEIKAGSVIKDGEMVNSAYLENLK